MTIRGLTCDSLKHTYKSSLPPYLQLKTKPSYALLLSYSVLLIAPQPKRTQFSAEDFRSAVYSPWGLYACPLFKDSIHEDIMK